MPLSAHRPRTFTAVARALVVTVAALVLVGGTTPDRGDDAPRSTWTGSANSRPVAVDNTVGVVAIHSSSGASCSGMPLRGTRLIVTVAHCIVDDRADEAPSGTGILRRQHFSVTVDGVTVGNPVEWVAIHPAYFASAEARNDVAVLTTEHSWPYGADGVGWGTGPVSSLYAYGIQSIGADGGRLTPDEIEELTTPGRSCATACDAGIVTGVARCTLDPNAFTYRADAVHARCGLVHGASGGPVLVAYPDGSLRLVGVVSTVTVDDWAWNGFAAVDAVVAVVGGDGFYVETEPAAGVGNLPVTYTPRDVLEALRSRPRHT